MIIKTINHSDLIKNAGKELIYLFLIFDWVYEQNKKSIE